MDATRVCEECTQNCMLVHGLQMLELDPAADKSFIKILYGSYDFSQFLYLPPKVPQITIPALEDGQYHLLEDFTGKRWLVTLGTNHGALAFEKGWDQFYADHELKKGYVLQFYYTGSHFIVKIYDTTGTQNVLFRENNNMRMISATDGRAEVEWQIIPYALAENPASTSLAPGSEDNWMQSQAMTMNEPPSAENRERRSKRPSRTFLRSRAEKGRENQGTAKDKDSVSQIGNGGFKVPSTSTVRAKSTRDNQTMTKEKAIGNSAILMPSDGIGSHRMSKHQTSGSENGHCALRLPSHTSPITSTENRRDSQVTDKANPVSKKARSVDPPAEVADATPLRIGVLLSDDNDCQVDLSDIPLRKRVMLHRGNTTKSSNKSKIVASQEAVGSSKHSRESKVPEKGQMELSVMPKVPSDEQSNSGKHPKSNDLDQNSSGIEKGKEVQNAVNIVPVESHDQEFMSCKAVVESEVALELQESLPSFSLRKGMDRKGVILRGPDELCWQVLYVETHGLKALISGWKNFYHSNGLQKGDECTFVLETNEGDPIYNVNIVRKVDLE